MRIDPRQHDPRQIYKLMIGSIVPRPIAFVSTVSKEGVRNLAPFSFFMGVCADPPIVAFSTTLKPGGDRRKDTLRNVEETGNFVVNVVTETIAEAMNACSGEYPPEVDEFEVSGLTPVASELVQAPRVKESPVNMECRLHQVIPVGGEVLGARLVLGEVVRFHVDDAMVDDFKIDPEKLLAIGRMGGMGYARTRDRFELMRPKV